MIFYMFRNDLGGLEAEIYDVLYVFGRIGKGLRPNSLFLFFGLGRVLRCENKVDIWAMTWADLEKYYVSLKKSLDRVVPAGLSKRVVWDFGGCPRGLSGLVGFSSKALPIRGRLRMCA